MKKVDLLVVGSGPAGQRAAIQASKLGKSVIMVERRSRLGGVTVRTGTIPSKTLRETILYLTGWRQRGFYGRDYRLKSTITTDDLAQRLQLTIRHEIEVIENKLQRNNVTVITGEASFIDSHSMKVVTKEGGNKRIHADKIILATGTRPRRPDNVPFDEHTIIDSDGILKLERIPKSAIVYGAGIIGIEYASMFNALDIEIILIHEKEKMLPFIDHDVMDEFTHHLCDSGMRIQYGEILDRITHDNNGHVNILFKSGRSATAEILLFTAGRIGCTSALNLENAGLKANHRHQLKVDKNFQTQVPHIYAVGDLIGFPSLASTSMEQGRIAACRAFGEECHASDNHFPIGIFSVPEISTIGKTSQKLNDEGVAFEIGTARFRETARGQILGLREGLLKLLVDLDNQRILGVHIVGEGATELIHIGQAVMMLGGKLDYFIENTFNYPTLAETYKIAALDAWNRIR